MDDILNGPYTGADDVAAVVIESQQGEGGYVAPPPEFLEMIKAACEKNGCLYIADEVQSGAGRTGKMWAIQHSKVVPDMLTWGKGMGGDMPMAGVTYRSDMEEALREGSQPSTFAGNAMACEVSMTNIDIITDPETDLLGRAAALGEEIKGLFTDAMPNVPVIGDVRGNGLMVGIEVVADRKTKEPLAGEKIGEIAFKLLNRGILMTPCGRHGNVFRFMPPLTIPQRLRGQGDGHHARHPQGVLSRRGVTRSRLISGARAGSQCEATRRGRRRSGRRGSSGTARTHARPTSCQGPWRGQPPRSSVALGRRPAWRPSPRPSVPLPPDAPAIGGP